MSNDGHDLLEQLREEIDGSPVNERDEQDVSVAIERYERALHRVLDALHNTPTADSSVALINQNKMARELAAALGIELPLGGGD